MYAGQTLPALQLTVTQDGGAVVSLVGATLTLKIKDVYLYQERAGAGVFTLTNPLQGQATYAWAAADTAVIGTFEVQISITTAQGTLVCDPIPWSVVAN